ncbi:MAG: hypothetical protein CMO01_28365 [Thalassobius sp.]|nr:hypothetical protein [Thalassovita sp.]
MKNKLLALAFSFVVLTFSSQIAFAQEKGAVTAGGGFVYGSSLEKLGIGLTGQYYFTDNLAGEVGLNFFFPDKYRTNNYEAKYSVWTINLNVNYYFNTQSDVVKPYVLGGLNFANIKSKVSRNSESYSDTHTEVGINLGGGLDFTISDKVTPFFNMKYVVSDLDQLVIGAGVRFNLK